jgi:hypothetical protein
VVHDAEVVEVGSIAFVPALQRPHLGRHGSTRVGGGGAVGVERRQIERAVSVVREIILAASDDRGERNNRQESQSTASNHEGVPL